MAMATQFLSAPFPDLGPSPLRFKLQTLLVARGGVAFLFILTVLTGCESTQVFFSPEDEPESKVVAEIDAASQEAHVAIYTFTSEPIRDALINAFYRGVDVKVYADPWEANDPILASLTREGIPVRISANAQGGIMHNKFVVLDGVRVVTGSFNYTDSANLINDENLLILSSPRLASQYEAKFQELWVREQ